MNQISSSYVMLLINYALLWKIEFNQVLQSDACRLQQLQCHTASPGHPFNRFFWGKSEPIIFHFVVKMVSVCVNYYIFLVGNKKSLVDAMEKGINLRKQILNLYKDFYHGGLMKLVVIGGGKVFFSLISLWCHCCFVFLFYFYNLYAFDNLIFSTHQY